MYKFTKGILPLVMVLTEMQFFFMIIIILNLTVIVTAKIAYAKDKILPHPQKLYTGMPVMPVTNSRSAVDICWVLED